VYLPAGQHTIEFIYQPRAFYSGAAISAVGWIALLALAAGRACRHAIGAARRKPAPSGVST
jgi:hypothetical protein